MPLPASLGGETRHNNENDEKKILHKQKAEKKNFCSVGLISPTRSFQTAFLSSNVNDFLCKLL